MNVYGPTPKYRDLDRDPVDGTPLSWRAHPDGYPVRAGDAPGMLEKSHLEGASVTFYARSEVLQIPDELERYTAIVDWIANSRGVLRFEERRADPGDPTKWTVWICWLDVRGVFPHAPGSNKQRFHRPAKKAEPTLEELLAPGGPK